IFARRLDGNIPNAVATRLWLVPAHELIFQKTARRAMATHSPLNKCLLLRSAATARSYTLLALPARQDEMIIVAVTSPGTRWHIPHFYELPVGHIRRRQAQIISYRRGHIQSRSVVKVRFGTLIAENVLKMVRPKRTAILPLRVTHAIAFANGYPAMTAGRLARPGIGLLKPRDH